MRPWKASWLVLRRPVTKRVAARTCRAHTCLRRFALVGATHRLMTLRPFSFCAKARLTRAGWSSTNENVVPIGARFALFAKVAGLPPTRQVECDCDTWVTCGASPGGGGGGGGGGG